MPNNTRQLEALRDAIVSDDQPGSKIAAAVLRVACNRALATLDAEEAAQPCAGYKCPLAGDHPCDHRHPCAFCGLPYSAHPPAAATPAKPAAVPPMAKPVGYRVFHCSFGEGTREAREKAWSFRVEAESFPPGPYQVRPVYGDSDYDALHALAVEQAQRIAELEMLRHEATAAVTSLEAQLAATPAQEPDYSMTLERGGQGPCVRYENGNSVYIPGLSIERTEFDRLLAGDSSCTLEVRRVKP